MTISRRTFTKRLLGTSALLAAPGILRAQDTYPIRQVNYVIPFAPGGESDVTARMQQAHFESITGQQLVIQNKPGAGGATAWAQLNGYEPDGHTVMGTIVPHTILQPAIKDVGYVTDDITNVHFFHYTPDAVIVRADSKYETLHQMLDDATMNPGMITLGGSGTNTANHLALQILGDLTATAMTYIPFKGSAPAITALLGGQIAGAISYTTQGVKAGDQVRVLAVATDERHPALPDAPTFRELGIDYVGGAYRGVAVPKGTPVDVQDRLSGIIAEINAIPSFQQQMSDAGYTVTDILRADVPGFIADKAQEYAAAISHLKSS
jgi:tripartite-type tricarboxylate transporter receptor subunit TctC